MSDGAAAAAAPAPVIIRAMGPADEAFVYSRWISSFSKSWLARYAGDSYEQSQRRVIAKLLHRGAMALVAESSTTPGLLLGFVCAEPPGVLHYVYVRPEMRLERLARQLFGAAGLAKLCEQTICTHEPEQVDTWRTLQSLGVRIISMRRAFE